MSDPEVFVLEKAWKAQTDRVWKIEFERLDVEVDKEHFYFRFTCTRADEGGEPFIFTPQISRRLLTDLGIDPEGKPKLLMRLAAGQGLEDVKIRLNAGHDHNFNNLPYCKTYTSRDAEKFRKYLPKVG